MKYLRSEHYTDRVVKDKIMGPNPIKLTEELLEGHKIPKNALVMDLGSGQGLTSVFLAKEYGFRVVAADLWSDPTENMRFFEEMGLTREAIMPVKADAENLPFAHDTFDAIVSVDSYHYFGRSESYLGDKLLPFVRRGGYVYIAIPGMKKDCHDCLPQELLLSWNEEQLAYMRDKDYWRHIVSFAKDAEVISVEEMESNDEVWKDWLECENEYAVNDRKSMNAGAGKYLNFIKIIIRRRE